MSLGSLCQQRFLQLVQMQHTLIERNGQRLSYRTFARNLKNVHKYSNKYASNILVIHKLDGLSHRRRFRLQLRDQFCFMPKRALAFLKTTFRHVKEEKATLYSPPKLALSRKFMTQFAAITS